MKTERLNELERIAFLRWFWRQLTSMRIALILLLLLAVASIPGSIFPQRTQNPIRVQSFLTDNPEVGKFLDRLGFFDVYGSAWFSAIYLLLFISLIGCVLPRALVHFKESLAQPTLVPRYLDKMPHYEKLSNSSLKNLEQALKKNRYRIRIENSAISAEKGYLRETGNLLFHLSLVVVLVAIALGALYGNKGDVILNTGEKFINVPTSYDNLNFGRFQNEQALPSFKLEINEFRAKYDPANNQPLDYLLKANLDISGGIKPVEIRVNQPLAIGSTRIYLQANGYAPIVQVKDKSDKEIFNGSVNFLPQDANLTSIGAIKIPDMNPQIGFVSSFLPTADRDPVRGGFSSYPEVLDPRLLISVWQGDLGMNTGIPQSVYRINTSQMQQIGLKALSINESYDFGVGTITFLGWKPWVNLQIVNDPGKTLALIGAILATIGLLMSLFIRQRRVWVKKIEGGVEIAGLSKNEIPGLAEEIKDLIKISTIQTNNDKSRSKS